MMKIVNYAKREEVKKQAEEKVNDIFNSCMTNRQDLEDDWKRFEQIWSIKRQDNQRYAGRANLRFPSTRRSAETLAKRLHNALLPDENYLSVSPKPGQGTVTMQNADAVENILLHYFEGPSKLRSAMFPCYRQFVVYGTTIVKTGWKRQYKLRRQGNKYKEYLFSDYPLIKTVDLFDFYAFPWTARDLRDCQMTIERFVEFESYLKDMEREGYYVDLEGIEPNTKEDSNLNDRLSEYGINDPATIKDHGQKVYTLQEVYTEMEVEKGHTIPVMIHAQENGKVFLITDNPYDHCELPYSSAKFVENLAPIIYGQGCIEPVESLANMENDFANQIMDCKNFIMQPILIVDPNKNVDHRTIKFAPAAKWLAEKDSVSQFVMQDTTQTGIQGLQIIKGEILEGTEAMPNMPTQMRGASRTATRDRVMTQELSSEMSDALRSLSIMMEDIVRKTHSNIIQEMPEKMTLKILRKTAGDFMIKQVTRDDIIGDYDFVWKAANKTALNTVQAQQLINGVKVFADAGVPVNFEAVAKRFFKDALNMKDIDDIFPSMAINSMAPDEENKILDMARFVGISINDNDEEHYNNHMAKREEASNPAVIKAYDDHLSRHQDAIKIKQQEVERAKAEAMAQQVQIEQQMMSKAGGAGRPQNQMGGTNQGTTESNVTQGIREV